MNEPTALNLIANTCLTAGMSLQQARDCFEKELITLAISGPHGITGGAQQLHVHRNTLQRKMRILGIRTPHLAEARRRRRGAVVVRPENAISRLAS